MHNRPGTHLASRCFHAKVLAMPRAILSSSEFLILVFTYPVYTTYPPGGQEEITFEMAFFSYYHPHFGTNKI